jgi:virginiamycin B lyase
MKAHIGSALIVLALIAAPLSADLGGITTTPINLPAKVYAATVGPDGNVWILTDQGKLGKLTPAGAYTEFPLQFGTSVFSLTSGIDGNLWIPGPNGHVERVTTSGVVTDFAVAPNFYFPYPAVSGADGAIWFYGNQRPSAGGSNTWKLGRIDIYGQFTTYDLGISDLSGSGDFLRSLVSGGDGSLWFIDETKNQVIKFSLVTKSIAGRFPIPSASSGSDDQMVLGWDGNVWFTRGTSIDRVTPDGTIMEFHVPSGGKPAAILMAGDGNIWFTEPDSGVLGQLVMSSITSGGSATFNESAAGIAPDVQQLFINVPPAFADSTGASAQVLNVVPNADICRYTVVVVDSNGHMRKLKIDVGGGCSVALEQVFLQAIPNAVAIDMKQLITPAAQGSTIGASGVRGPDQAAALTATLNLSAQPGMTISNVSTSDPSATVSFSGLKATITSSMSSVTATVSVSPPPGGQIGSIAGAAVLASSVTDPDPRQHVSSFFLDASSLGGRRGAIPPDLSDVVNAPIHRGH